MNNNQYIFVLYCDVYETYETMYMSAVGPWINWWNDESWLSVSDQYLLSQMQWNTADDVELRDVVVLPRNTRKHRTKNQPQEFYNDYLPDEIVLQIFQVNPLENLQESFLFTNYSFWTIEI